MGKRAIASDSPTVKALKFYRAAGGECVVLEHYVHHARTRRDIWGADILCLQGQKLIAVQATDGTNHSKRVAKSIANPMVACWLKGGVAFEVFSESMRGARYHKKKLVPRITQLSLSDHDKVIVL
jgi:hypothetical protein